MPTASQIRALQDQLEAIQRKPTVHSSCRESVQAGSSEFDPAQHRSMRKDPDLSEPGAPGDGRPRVTSACQQCRRLKIKCIQGSDISDGPAQCDRCARMGIECLIVQSRRGRTLGSKNRWRGLDNSVAHVRAALDTLLESGPSNHSSRKDRKQSLDHSGQSQGLSELGCDPQELDPVIMTDPAHQPLVSLLTLAKSRSSRLRTTDHDGSLSPAMDDDGLDLSVDHGDLQDFNSVFPLESRQSPPPSEGPENEAGPLAALNTVGSLFKRQHSTISPIGQSQHNCIEFPSSETFPGWTDAQLRVAAGKKARYFAHSASATKRDVAPELDPITKGILNEQLARALHQKFFEIFQPQIGFLDPILHTIPYIREHSALLTTVIFATVASTEPEAATSGIAKRLYAHADRLLMIIHSCHAKSVGIVQALLVLSLWPRCPVRSTDDKSRTWLAMALHMATEIGLYCSDRRVSETDDRERQNRDGFRTWLTLIIQDKSSSAFCGLPTSAAVKLEMQDLRAWLDSPLAHAGDSMLCAFIELRRLEKTTRERLSQDSEPYIIEGIREGAIKQITGWMAHWCNVDLMVQAPNVAHMMIFIAHHVNLLILHTRPPHEPSDTLHARIIADAKSCLEIVVNSIGHGGRYLCRTVCSMICWAAIILLKKGGSEHRDLVHNAALLMAPCGDGRFEGTFADFYGSLLLGFSIEQYGTPLAAVNPMTFRPLEDSQARTAQDSDLLSSLWQSTQSFHQAPADDLRLEIESFNFPTSDMTGPAAWPDFDFPILESPFRSGFQDTSLDWLLGDATTTGDGGNTDPSQIWPDLSTEGILPWTF